MKLLIYSHDTYGLGNIRRTLAVATYLTESNSDLSVLILSGSPMLHAFRIPAGIDYVKLPCVSRTADGEYISPYLDVSLDKIMHLRRNLVLSTVLDYQPDVLLVDKKPLGLSGELEPALDMLNRRSDRPRQYLLLRDILDEPAVTREIWQRNRYLDVIENWYDGVLVAGDASIFDVTNEYGFSAPVASKTHYCGYLERLPGRRTPAQVRNRLGIDDRPLVLVTAGGGADGERLLSTMMQTISGADDTPGFHTLVYTGSELPAGQRASLQAQAGQSPAVTIREFTGDMMSYMNAADLVVSMGGYNTMCELLTLGKLSIIVPRTEPVREQCLRAERFAALGLARMIHPDLLTPARLSNVIQEALGSSRGIPQKRFRLDGLINIRLHLFGKTVDGTVDQMSVHGEARPGGNYVAAVLA